MAGRFIFSVSTEAVSGQSCPNFHPSLGPCSPLYACSGHKISRGRGGGMNSIQTRMLTPHQRARKILRANWLGRRQVSLRPVQSKDVSVILPARNEAHGIAPLVRRLRQWPAVREVIVVANGCRDNTARQARLAGARVVQFTHPLGHDCGRAIGAAVAKGPILLFLDADISWQIHELRAFVQHVRQGADIALNAYPSPRSLFYHHPTAVAKRTLNLVCGRPDLGAASMTAVPYAMRRKALAVLDVSNLAIPPLAQATALFNNLRVVTATGINLHQRNRRRSVAATRATARLILGDHVEALSWYMAQQDTPRGKFADWRQHNVLNEMFGAPGEQTETQNLLENSPPHPIVLAAVIPASNEAASLPGVLTEVQKLGATTLVVSNGSEDETDTVAKRYGAKVTTYKTCLGHDVPRAVGAHLLCHDESSAVGRKTSPPACTLFIDADFSIPADDLWVMTRSVLEDGVDVALNGLPSQFRDPVSTVKTFLNLVLDRPDLGMASLTAVPHALSQRALASLATADLAIPPKALVHAVSLGLKVRAVHQVDVVSPNRYRPRWHSRRYGAPLTRMIVGDHLEALDLWTQLKGLRGGFPQNRRLDEMHAFLSKIPTLHHASDQTHLLPPEEGNQL
ncbi:glycosyltransferase [Alicyclobacillaceae bacterium I2511]|nr:glycosyltransferase [Alicyclobacillaceae bacterium I2511]